MLGLSKGSDSDVVKSSTLNLTKVATALAGVLGTLTVGTGLVGEIPSLPPEFLNFSSGQQVTIIVALIAGVAVVQAADLFSRAIASARGPVVIPLPKAIPARMRTADGDADGTIAALRADRHVLFCGEQDHRPLWTSEDSIRYK